MLCTSPPQPIKRLLPCPRDHTCTATMPAISRDCRCTVVALASRKFSTGIRADSLHGHAASSSASRPTSSQSTPLYPHAVVQDATLDVSQQVASGRWGMQAR